MGRFLGVGGDRGKGGSASGTIIETSAYDKSTGITTDANNNVTAVTLGNNQIRDIQYNSDGLINDYIEQVGNDQVGWRINYDSDFTVSSIVQYTPPTYNAYFDTYSIDEGSSIVFNVGTTDIVDGTQLYWEIEGVGGSPAATADFSASSGNITITSNSGNAQTITVQADTTTEGAETFVAKLYEDSSKVKLFATTPTVTINDTSTSITATPTAAAADVDEGSSLSISVSTSNNVSDGTTLYWDVSAASDFSTNNGSFTVNSFAGSFSVTPDEDTSTEGAETFTVRIYEDSARTLKVGETSAITINDTSLSPQVTYTTAGTYSWTCPAGVTSVSVVCVGGGGKGGGGGGGGGGLGWKNNISVTPGQSYTVQVGGRGTNTANGGDSYFISTGTVAGYGGKSATSTLGTSNTGGGSYTGDGGGSGGSGSSATVWGGGGGGAGGYSGNGGSANTNSGNNGNGGGGGGGAGHSSTDSNDGKRKGGGGGGVGLLGQGSNGSGAPNSSYGGDGGQGGSGGNNGNQSSTHTGGSGGNYGSGSGGSNDSSGSYSGSPGYGAVRIIWGSGRSFPSNAGDI